MAEECVRRRPGRKGKRRVLPKHQIIYPLLVVALFSRGLLNSVDGSSFPGTIKSTTPSASTPSDSWWNPNNPSSDDELSSSSDYEWLDEGIDHSVTEDEGEEEQDVQRQNGEISGIEDNDATSTSAGMPTSFRQQETTTSTRSTKRRSNPNGFVSTPLNELNRQDVTLQDMNSSPKQAREDRTVASTATSISQSSTMKSAANKTPNKPLKTIEKLQQMLDETDYMTSRRDSHRSMEKIPNQPSPPSPKRSDKQQQTQAFNKLKTSLSNSGRAPIETLKRTIDSEQSIDERRQDQHDDGLPLQGNAALEGEMQSERGDNEDELEVGRQETQLLSQQQKQEQLWTSKDRSKYKRQQQRLRQKQEDQDSYYRDPYRLREYQQQKVYEQQQQRLNQKRQPPPPPSTPREPLPRQYQQAHISDGEDQSDTDDGLGYTLPNLPIYYSDAENDSDDADAESVFENQPDKDNTQSLTDETIGSRGRPASQQPMQHNQTPQASGWDLQQTQQPLNNGQMQGPYSNYPAPYGLHPPPPSNTGAPPPHMSGYPYPPPYYYASPQYQQQAYAAYMNAWRNAAIQGSYSAQRLPQSTTPTPAASAVPRIDSTVPKNPKVTDASKISTGEKESNSQVASDQPIPIPQSPYPFYGSMPVEIVEQSQQQNEAVSSRLTFVSVQKLATCIVLGALVCYSAVSPRTLPLVEYNQHFYTNMRIAYLAIIPPTLIFLFVLNPSQNDVNQLVNCFYNSFTVGYALAFVMEIVAATVVRLIVFRIWEPDVFKLAPTPFFLIPWTLREHKYKPKRISLFAADLASSCVACPLVEEYLKLKLLQFTVQLPRNFQWVTKTSSKSKKKRKVAEPVRRTSLATDNEEVTNINRYISSMLAISIGMKLADAVRRICMYTKVGDKNKSFYAFFRGVFPIHELCGTVTALALARRDVLGQSMPLWKLLLPSVIIHAMANFRGMKPIFKWNSATPWSEMQLSPDIPVDDATLGELAGKAFPKIMWLIILFRVLGYCVKNYYMVNRHAVKRTTTFAGKHAAFSAALEATETLKRSKKKN